MVNVFSGVQFRKGMDLQSDTELLHRNVYAELGFGVFL